MKVRAVLAVVALAMACDSPTVGELMAQGCEDVLAGDWEQAKEPLRAAAEASDWGGEAYRLYSFVAHAHPADPPGWYVDEVGPEEAYRSQASAAEFGEAWEANAIEMCEQLPSVG